MILDIGVFPLLAGQGGVEILQLLGRDEADFPAQSGGNLGETDVQTVVGVADGLNNGSDDEL